MCWWLFVGGRRVQIENQSAIRVADYNFRVDPLSERESSPMNLDFVSCFCR